MTLKDYDSSYGFATKHQAGGGGGNFSSEFTMMYE
jgi:hypothetical protein